MPVVSVIPKLYENPCDCLLIIYFKSLNNALQKQAGEPRRGAEQYSFC